MPPADLSRVRHMLDAAVEAVEFHHGKTVNDLLRDRVLALALVRCLEIIGEAASKVSPATRGEYPSVPWVDIIGMRNRLIHAYFDIDISLIEQTVTGDLPTLIDRLKAIVASAE
jgi:uncharacterized protein with HEPN domain